MPYDQVPAKWKAGTLRSGSGKKVTSRKQMVAIMLSEKRKAQSGKTEYGVGAKMKMKRHGSKY